MLRLPFLGLVLQSAAIAAADPEVRASGVFCFFSGGSKGTGEGIYGTLSAGRTVSDIVHWECDSTFCNPDTDKTGQAGILKMSLKLFTGDPGADCPEMVWKANGKSGTFTTAKSFENSDDVCRQQFPDHTDFTQSCGGFGVVQ